MSSAPPSKPTASVKGIAELTTRVFVLGIVLSVVMGAANVYLGLKAGLTVSASIPAAVIAMLILRKVMGNGTILEANQVQTAASAGESLAAGIIFTMPALVLIGVWTEFNYWLTTAVAFTGGLLGILFMIPMRRVFVAREVPELTYPEGVACAAVLEAGGADDDKTSADDAGASAIIEGAVMGAIAKLLISFVGAVKTALAGAVAAGGGRTGPILFFGGDISPALIAVGYIVRLNIAILIFIGGALGWLVGIPLLTVHAPIIGEALQSAFVAVPLDDPEAIQRALALRFDVNPLIYVPEGVAGGTWSSKIRYIGVGAMVVGGLAAIVKVRGGLVAAIQEIRSRQDQEDAVVVDEDRDLPSSAILTLSAVATLLVGVVYWWLTQDIMITLVTTVIMLTMSLFFTAVASYIVGLVGNSNSPVSGMTITAVLFTGALLLVFGFSGTQGMVATLGVAAVVCCAACTSGDVCNDLKTGQMVGATPYRQQIMQVTGVTVAALVMAPVLTLLHENTPGGIGGEELPAPQAGLFAALAEGFFGDATLPWDMVAIGAGLGVAMVIIDLVLERRKSTFRAHVMPIAVGIYLPFELAPPILAGGLIAHFMAKRADATSGEAQEVALRRGVLLSSGAIAGEALMGVGLAVLASIGLQRLDLGIDETVQTVLTAAMTVGVLAFFWSRSRTT